MENELLKGVQFATESLFPIMCIISLVFALILKKLFSRINEISVKVWVQGCFCFSIGIIFVACRDILPLYWGYVIGNALIAYSHYLCLKSCENFFNLDIKRSKVPEIICIVYGFGFAAIKTLHGDLFIALYVGLFTVLFHFWIFLKLKQLQSINQNDILKLIGLSYLLSVIIWLMRVLLSDFYQFGESLNPGFVNWFTLLVLTLIMMTKHVFFIAMLQERTNHNLFGAQDIIRQRDNLIDSLNDEKYKYEMANAAKSQFLANVSHELRTPLHGLIGMLSIALKSDISTSVHKSIDKAIYSAKALLNILNEILDFAKIEAGIMTVENIRFSTKQLFDDVRDLFELAAKDKHLEFNFEIDPLLPQFVVGDFYKIRQVLFNLVGNSIKFTNSGSLKIQANVNHIDSNWLNLTITVIDTGIGIENEKISEVLQPFNQVDNANSRSYQGVGLGLPISEKILSNLGSNLSIKSEPNVGTEMSFSLRLRVQETNEAPFHSQNNESQIVKADFQKFSALIAEDNPVNAEVIKQYLDFLKIKAHFVSNGQECLQYLENNVVDFVLMDIQMPILDGLDTSRLIRSNPKYEGIFIFGLSASAAQSDYALALQSGMNDFLVKPFDLDSFSKILIKHLNTK